MTPLTTPVAPPTVRPPPHTEPQRESLLLAYLAANPGPCPVCGYDLANLRSPRCPECGEELTLRVGALYPRQGAFLTGLIALAAGAGFSGLLLVFALIMSMLHGGPGGPPARIWILLAGGSLLEGGLLGLWLLNRRRLAKLAPRQRLRLALACCAATGANVVLFSVLAK